MVKKTFYSYNNFSRSVYKTFFKIVIARSNTTLFCGLQHGSRSLKSFLLVVLGLAAGAAQVRDLPRFRAEDVANDRFQYYGLKTLVGRTALNWLVPAHEGFHASFGTSQVHILV